MNPTGPLSVHSAAHSHPSTGRVSPQFTPHAHPARRHRFFPPSTAALTSPPPRQLPAHPLLIIPLRKQEGQQPCPTNLGLSPHSHTPWGPTAAPQGRGNGVSPPVAPQIGTISLAVMPRAAPGANPDFEGGTGVSRQPLPPQRMPHVRQRDPQGTAVHQYPMWAHGGYRGPPSQFGMCPWRRCSTLTLGLE